MRHADLQSAGRDLAIALDSFASRPDTVVVGIVRGGVPAAVEIAALLALPLDLLLLNAVLQGPSGRAVRAVSAAGTLVLEDGLSGLPAGSVEAHFVQERIAALADRERLCRGDRAPLDLRGKTILLVDNGMRTGGTMLAAIAALRRLESGPIIAAVPVAAPASREFVEAAADELVCLGYPEPFGHVGMFYERFEVPSEGEIRELVGGRRFEAAGS